MTDLFMDRSDLFMNCSNIAWVTGFLQWIFFMVIELTDS
jgi:hypothetical protein